MPMMTVGTGRALLGGRGAVQFILREHFLTDQVAPLAGTRTCEPGPGQLNIIDSASTLDIANDTLEPNAATTDTRDPWLHDEVARARIAGRAACWYLRRVSAYGSASNSPLLGWANTLLNTNTNRVYGLLWVSDGTYAACAAAAPTPVLVGTLADNALVRVFSILRTTGFYLVVDGALRYVGNAGSEASLYASLVSRNVGSYPAAVRKFEVSDFLGGVWASQNALAQAAGYYSATSTDGQSFNHPADCLIEHTITAATGVTQELILRQTDANNCWIVRMNQGASTITLIEKNAGVETSRSNVAQTWTNGATYRLLVIASGTTIVTLVADIRKNSYTSASFNQTATAGSVSHAGDTLAAYPQDVSPYIPASVLV